MPLVMVVGSIFALAVLALLYVPFWIAGRRWIVNKAVDRGACSTSRHIRLSDPSSEGRNSRKLILGSQDCMRQIVSMLSNAPNFECKTGGGITACNHPLNASDSSTMVRIIVARDKAVLTVIPT